MNLMLPHPDIDIISSILTEIKFNDSFEQDRLKHTQLFSEPVNIARCEYYFTLKLKNYVKQVYQKFFEEEIQPVIICLVNTNPNQTAFYMPHVDKKRLVSLNYCLDAGGTDVMTSFYKQTGNYSMSGSSCTYKDVELETTVQFNKPEWYLLDVNRYHSVENIKGKRMHLALSFSDITCEQFTQKYKNLLMNTKYI